LNTPIPLLRRGGRQFPSRKRGMRKDIHPTPSLPPQRGRMKVGEKGFQGSVSPEYLVHDRCYQPFAR